MTVDVMPIWFEFATFDGSGYVNGIREDAPQNAKKAYDEYIKEQQTAVEAGERIEK